MNKYKYRLWDGLIIKSDTFTYVKTVSTTDETYYEINPTKNELIIHFTVGSVSRDIDIPFAEYVFNTALTPAEFELVPCAYMNGFEFYLNYNSNCKAISQYLVTDKLGDTRVGLDNDTLILSLNKSFIDLHDVSRYQRLCYRTGDVYAKQIDDEFEFSNYTFVEFNGLRTGANDHYIYGTTEAFAVNAVTNISEFVRALEEAYPDISIFVDDHDRDESKSEWIQVKAQLDEVVGGYHTVVHESPDRGRWSQASAKVQLEYTTNDIMLSLTRRDQYLHGQFLNDIRVVEFMRGNTKFGCSVFWERNDISSDKPVEDTSFDNSGYRLFTYNISCVLYFKIAELVDRQLPTILHVIYSIGEMTNSLELDRRVVIYNEEN